MRGCFPDAPFFVGVCFFRAEFPPSSPFFRKEILSSLLIVSVLFPVDQRFLLSTVIHQCKDDIYD